MGWEHIETGEDATGSREQLGPENNVKLEYLMKHLMKDMGSKLRRTGHVQIIKEQFKHTT